MNGRLHIFVAGPYCPYGAEPHRAIQLAQRNVDRAIEFANALIAKGHYPFVPHLTHYLHTHYSCPIDRGNWYYEYDNTFLDRWADAIFLIESSPGADKEVERALSQDKHIFRCLKEVPDVSGHCRKEMK